MSNSICNFSIFNFTILQFYNVTMSIFQMFNFHFPIVIFQFSIFNFTILQCQFSKCLISIFHFLIFYFHFKISNFKISIFHFIILFWSMYLLDFPFRNRYIKKEWLFDSDGDSVGALGNILDFCSPPPLKQHSENADFSKLYCNIT